MTALIFDIETIPDVDFARRFYNLNNDIDDNQVAQLMFAKRKQATGNDFLALPMHRIVAISIVLKTSDQLNIWSLGNEDSSEKELIKRFFDGIQRYTPTLVSWNGSGFDLPVLHYRALKHGINSSQYWESGTNDREFKWNNYLNRFHQRHIDLMDVLAGFQSRSFASLDVVATLLNLPGKLDMTGASVWEYYKQGKIKDIRDYCETDVINTYLIYLRWLLISAEIDDSQYDDESRLVSEFLDNSNQPHLKAYLSHWQKQSESK